MQFQGILSVALASLIASVVAQTATRSASAALSSASILAALPACARPCIAPALALSGCSLTNITCICTDQTFNCALGPCEEASCSLAEFNQLVPYVSNLCNPITHGIETMCHESNVSTAGVGNSTGLGNNGSTLNGNGSIVTSPTPTPSGFTGQGNGMLTSGASFGLTGMAIVIGAVIAWL